MRFAFQADLMIWLLHNCNSTLVHQTTWRSKFQAHYLFLFSLTASLVFIWNIVTEQSDMFCDLFWIQFQNVLLQSGSMTVTDCMWYLAGLWVLSPFTSPLSRQWNHPDSSNPLSSFKISKCWSQVSVLYQLLAMTIDIANSSLMHKSDDHMQASGRSRNIIQPWTCCVLIATAMQIVSQLDVVFCRPNIKSHAILLTSQDDAYWWALSFVVCQSGVN